jgi:hypothetical protein
MRNPSIQPEVDDPVTLDQTLTGNDFARLLERSQEEGWSLVVLDLWLTPPCRTAS